MKYLLSSTLAFIASGTITLAPNPAHADAVGPYYATPSWDQTLPSSTRFIVLSNMNSEAVLDRETGLVWERSPNTSSTFDWIAAHSECRAVFKGNRYGWRLPTIQELQSLVDPSVPPPGPTLPAGHPFQNIQTSLTSLYWSANTNVGALTQAWTVIFRFGSTSNAAKLDFHLVWCVRGGSGVDPQ